MEMKATLTLEVRGWSEPLAATQALNLRGGLDELFFFFLFFL